jgi:RHS repeat-associated protein
MQVVGQTAVTYGYDDSNRLTSITQGTPAVTIAYDPGNRRTALTMPNNTRVVYGWDDASQLTSLTYRQNSPDALLGNVTYTYDLAGRRIAMGGSYARVALPPALASATYDANNRLTNWAGTTLNYDDNGNLTGDGAFSYTWDSRDRLTGITGAPTSSFAYDPAGRRMTRTVAGSAVGYVYDGWNVVHTHAAGTINSTLLNGLGLDERYSRTNAGGTVAFLTDALGSTLHLRSAGGANTATYTYEPYGAATSSGTDSTAFGYTGREDDGNGLMYYRNRYYHPRFSRFISEDPIGLAGGDNAYRYVDGSPVLSTDPRGLDNPGMGPYDYAPGPCPIPPVRPPGVDPTRNVSSAERYGPAYVVYQVWPGNSWDYKAGGNRSYESFGNFNYGMTMAAAGVPDSVILRGAGAAQEYLAPRNYDPSFGHWYRGSPYGDAPHDQKWIRDGIKFYRCGCHRQ